MHPKFKIHIKLLLKRWHANGAFYNTFPSNLDMRQINSSRSAPTLPKYGPPHIMTIFLESVRGGRAISFSILVSLFSAELGGRLDFSCRWFIQLQSHMSVKCKTTHVSLGERGARPTVGGATRTRQACKCAAFPFELVKCNICSCDRSIEIQIKKVRAGLYLASRRACLA